MRPRKGALAACDLPSIATPGDVEATRDELKRLVYEPLQSIGGSIAAEHGIGLERKKYLNMSRTPQEIATMRAIKAALDPKRILNPGKIFD